MLSPVRIYILVVLIAALLFGGVVYLLSPQFDAQSVQAVLAMTVLAAVAQLLVYSAPRGQVGTINFIPTLAGVLLAPNWIAVVAMGVAMALTETIRRRPVEKLVFNASMYSLAGSIAIIGYRLVGGESLLVGAPDLSSVFSWSHLAPASAMVALFLVVTSTAVTGVIATSQRHPIAAVWRSTFKSNLIYDFLSSPVVLLLAWVYARFGFRGALIFSAPLLVVREIYKTNHQLERVNQELLELMIKAIEARDPYTSGHSRRVSQYSKIIARAVGLGSAEIERIGTAALLHDVGKIYEVYAPILRKPEKLSPAEWAVMQTHPIKSAELVSTVSHLKDVIAPVRHHHENWDGTGYPDGLVGEQIPVGSRVVLFADTIDAMTTDRPYRKALSEAQVRSEIVKFRGKQFDPEMCDKLLASPMFGLLFAPNARENTPEHLRPVVQSRADRLAARVAP